MAVTMVAALLGSWSVDSNAATDPCAVLKVEEISKILGETFGPASRREVPANHNVGTFVSCDYKGNTLGFSIISSEFLNAAARAEHLGVMRGNYGNAALHAVEIQGVGDETWYRRNLIDSIHGTHQYHFSISAPGQSASLDYKDKLVSIASLYFSRVP